MDPTLTPLERLSGRLRDASDDGHDAEAVVRGARTRALRDFGARPARPVARWAFVAVAAALAVPAIGLGVHRLRAPLPITFTVGQSHERREVGDWIAAESSLVPIVFSEGTRLELVAGTRTRVTSADSFGAGVLLEKGAVHATVVHLGPSTRWALAAGPFEIRVVGTDFDASWEPTAEVLEVTMRDGQVTVVGPLLGSGHMLSKGERLRISVHDARMEVSPIGAATPAPEGPASPALAVPTASTSDVAPPTGPSSAAVADVAPAAPSWRELEASGKHREAMEAIDREGFDRVLARSSTSDLVALADAARYAGSFGRARAALLAARARGARGRSAFLLGKLAADHLGASGEAITWFQTYLSEEPGGGLAEQALGRIVELRKRSGDQGGARAAATAYLARYPSGAYAALAKSILEP